MNTLIKIMAALCFAGMILPAPAQEPGAPPEAAPLPSGIVEQARRRLVQLDVTVSGPPEAIGDLASGDFELVVGGRPITAFTLDHACATQPSPESPAPADVAAGEPAPAAPAVLQRVTYLFYFDQNHLTQEGRANALVMARELIGRLVVNGNRAMIVSDAQELRTFADVTEDHALLLDAVERIEHDKKQWNLEVWAENEAYKSIMEKLAEGDLDAARSEARRRQREETWRTEKALRRMQMVLGRFASVDPPKAVVYFADTMRKNAGAHFLSLFPNRPGEVSASEAAIEMSALTTGNVFERMLQEATAHGVRLYTVQAEGLVGQRMNGPPNLAYLRDAQDSLVALAHETGGESFLNGIKAERIAQRIEQDLSCVYLISFDAGGLPEDQTLPVRLLVHRPRVKAQVRGRVVLQSESSRLTSRLLAAFGAPDTVSEDLPLRLNVIPMDFKDGKYRALAQVVAGPSPLASATWDVGLSLVSRGQVREEAAARVAVGGGGVPVVYEAEIEFRPGPFEIVAVAHETESNRVATIQLDAEWPEPGSAAAAIPSLAVLQPAVAAFLREGRAGTRRTGAMALDAHTAADAGRATAVLSLICARSGDELRVERRLAGDSAASFDPLRVKLGDARCLLCEDRIGAGTMTEGDFSFEVRVFAGDEELVSSSTTFSVAPPPPAAAAAVRGGPP